MVTETLNSDEALLESLAFGLRNMAHGLDAPARAAQFGASVPTDFWAVMGKYKEIGWLDECAGIYKIIPAGALFADAIMRDILSC